MIRGVPAIFRDPLAWLENQVANHGDLVAFPMPRTPVLLVNTPSGARRVLQENHRNYTKHTIQYGALSLVTGDGLLTADGERWRRHRRLMQPAFHHGGLDGVAHHALAAAERLREAWDGAPPGTPVDADAATMRAMVDVVGHTVFAEDLAGAGERVVTAVEDGLRAVLTRARSPLAGGPFARLPTPSRRRLDRANATLDAMCADVVRRRRARGAGDRDGDLLALLLRADLRDDEIRNELVTLVIAGHETVASALTWTLHLLASEPKVQQRLHDELDVVLAGRPPAWSDLPALPYTRAVVDESLRLYPPAWVISRRASGPDEVDGVSLPEHTLVLISPWLLHRRATAWPDPVRFDPDRFLESPAEGVDRRERPDGSERPDRRGDYLPFGTGPRLCIGRDVALVESVLMLAALLRDRTVRRPNGARAPIVDARVTLRPRGGLPIVLENRSGTDGVEGSQIGNC
jgi:cytochrome P450